MMGEDLANKGDECVDRGKTPIRTYREDTFESYAAAAASL